MLTDEDYLGSVPDFLSVGTMLKATPAQEGLRRYIYLEASSEGKDQQNEIVLAKALEESAEHYLKFGNVDIDHKSMRPVAERFGIADPESWEIGVPEAVRLDGTKTFVKARLFDGDTPLANRSNMVWDSITKLNPPKRWYPSVGGTPLAKSIKIDPQTGARIGVVSKVRWTNIALTAEPVNQHVAGIATVPFGVLAKSWVAGQGFDLMDMIKSLDAGYSSDVATLTGGSALRGQSLDGVGSKKMQADPKTPASYYDFRNRLASAIRKGEAKDQTARGLTRFSVGAFGLEADEATEWVDRFLGDLRHGLKNRS